LKKIVPIVVLFLMLACNAIVGQPPATPVVAPTEAPPVASPTVTREIASETPVPAPTATPTATETEAPHGFQDVRLNLSDGDLPSQLAEQARNAAALNLMPVAYFDASW
jgi:hypothetical protein